MIAFLETLDEGANDALFYFITVGSFTQQGCNLQFNYLPFHWGCVSSVLGNTFHSDPKVAL